MTAASLRDPSRAQESAPAAGEQLGLRDPWLVAILGLCLLLQALTWGRAEGYPLGDSVEYMERALSLARAEPRDPSHALRSFGFSLLLVPFFLLADAFDLQDGRVVVGAVRVFQMLLGLGLVALCARIGAQLAGRRAGRAAALLVATNPVFLEYSITPVAGIAAALLVALGVERLLERAGAGRALAGGLALGGSFVLAYQTLPIGVGLIALCAWRDRGRGSRARAAAACAGFALCILAQAFLDLLTWGAFGASLSSYLVMNLGSVTVTLLVRLGLRDMALAVYQRAAELADFQVQVEGELRQLHSRTYYLSEIGRILSVPALAIVLAGALRGLRRASFETWTLIAVLGLNVLAMSMKGSKSFRLWLPLLPLIAGLCAQGFAALGSLRRPAGSVALVLLGAAALLGPRELWTRALAPYGVYWRAVELVNREVERRPARADRPAARERLGSAFHWAVFHRESERVELVKLPHHLDHWPRLGEEQRAACLESIRSLDWFLAHRPVLDLDPALFELVAERFELVDFFWEPGTEPSLGPVLVLQRIRDPASGRRLVERLPPEDPAHYRRRLGLDRRLLAPLDFLWGGAPGEPPEQRLTLLGWDYEELPHSGFGWIRYHWTSQSALDADLEFVDRLSAPDGRHAWQNDHRGGYGFVPTQSWRPGEIVREAYPVLAGADAFGPRFHPLGGAYRRGDLVPVELWIKVWRRAAGGAVEGAARPALHGAPFPLELERSRELAGGRLRSPEGHVLSNDELVRVGGLLIGVHPLFRWPDDGRGDPP